MGGAGGSAARDRRIRGAARARAAAAGVRQGGGAAAHLARARRAARRSRRGRDLRRAGLDDRGRRPASPRGGRDPPELLRGARVRRGDARMARALRAIGARDDARARGRPDGRAHPRALHPARPSRLRSGGPAEGLQRDPRHARSHAEPDAAARPREHRGHRDGRRHAHVARRHPRALARDSRGRRAPRRDLAPHER